MRRLKLLLILVLGLVVAGYFAVTATIYVGQRDFLYHPEAFRTAPDAAGMPEAEEFRLATADGEKIIVWHVAPRGDKPVILYFHGNDGSLRLRVHRFRQVTDDGTGLLALGYRGFSGSSGAPSEVGLVEDAKAIYGFASARYPVERLVAWGESLGSGVAVALASEQRIARLILEAPYASTVEIAGLMFPYLPVTWLMKDQFRSDLRIGKVTAPVLMMHGAHDDIIPIASAERLFALIRGAKTFVRFPEGLHHDLDRYGAVEVARAFIAGRLNESP